MTVMVAWIVGGLLMVVGMVYLTGGKFIVPRWADNLLFLAVILIVAYFRYRFVLPRKITLWFLVLFIIVGALMTLMSRGKFTAANIKKESFAEVLRDELADQGFAPALIQDIPFRESTNAVEFSLANFRKREEYGQILTGLKKRLRGVEEKIFPTAGVIYFGMGLIFLLLMLWIDSMPCPL